MSGPLYELALSVPWCCTGDALEAMLSIASREPLAEDEIGRRMHGPKSVALRSGQRRDDSRRMTMLGPVARIPIDGPIYRYADFFTSMSGGVTTESLARDLQAALDDPTVSGILLAIDSPGGEATGINELADTIHAARGKKPIVAYIEGYGASAAYWIASAADLVAVDDNALVGSIGTILGVPDPTKRPSLRIDIVSTQSPKKKPDVTTDEGRAILQQLADDMTDVFIAKVARNRRLEISQILSIAGGLLVGQQAVDAGLADRLGSEEGMLRALALGDLAAPQAPARPVFPVVSGKSAAKELTFMADEQNAKGFWAGLFGGARDAGLVAPASETASSAIATAEPLIMARSQADDDRAARATAENAELRKQLAQVRAAQIQAEAQAFAKEQIGAGHTYPVASAALIALYALAAEDDATAPLPDGRSRVSSVRAFVEAQPANRLASNLLDPAFTANSRALPSTGGASDTYAEDAASIRSYGEKANGKRA